LVAALTGKYFDSFIDGLIARDLLLIFLSFWQMRSLHGLSETEELLQLKVVLVLIYLFNFSSLWFLVIFFRYKLGFIEPSGLVKFYISTMDLQVCLVAGIYLSFGSHWSWEGGRLARSYKLDNERIIALLLEKEALVRNLLDTQALVETGALSTGLSHEINQFLAVIQANAELAITQLSGSERQAYIEPLLEKIINANQAAGTLIADLKRFFIKREGAAERCVFDDLVIDVTHLYGDKLRKSGIIMSLELDAKEPVNIWPSLMRQVLSNLVVNAIEALNCVETDDRRIQITTTRSHNVLSFNVSDNGPGIEASDLSEVFSLFKTSKENGTGVGLWLSLHIVEKHKGQITLKSSREGHEGVTAFEVTIPIGT